MPIAGLLFVINAGLILHAAKTGRFMPWAYVILFLPGLGAIGYVALVCAPEWLASPGGQRAFRRARTAWDPDAVYRRARDDLAAVDTIANKAALAGVCLETKREAEALTLYKDIVGHPLGQEPHFFLGKARSELELGHPEESLATLDELQQMWPSFQSPAGHLLYARSLEQAGRIEEAVGEFRSLATYFAGVEPRVRLARLLAQQGDKREAAEIAGQVAAALRRSPKHVQRAEREWGTLAKEVEQRRV